VRDLAADVLRHRLVLSYEALSEDVSADDVIERVVSAVMGPRADQMQPQAVPPPPPPHHMRATG
jgi:MoxR-like ATPase